MVTENKPKIKPATFVIGQSYHWPCQYCDGTVWSPRGLINAYLDCTCKAGKIPRDRELADERQRKLERANKLRATALEDRELAQKEAAMERREARQDTAEDASAEADGPEPLAAFEMPMDGSDLDNAPTAMLQRSDKATLLYDGKLNFLFGVPSSGKSWVALYAVHEALLRGQRAIYWDHEDTPSTLKLRSLLIGLDLADFWRDGQFKYLRPGLDGSTLAMTEAMEWVAGGDGPTLVVIDSAESAGCPSDGADVAPWLAKTVLPFRDAGASVLVLDHVPKQRINRPMGPIGSQHKLARVDGAALYVSGVPWTQKADGYLTLFNHKDRHGQLPAPIGKAVARLIGTHEGDTLALSIVAPEAEDNVSIDGLDLTASLQAIADIGVIVGYEALVESVGAGSKAKRLAIVGELKENGYITKSREGKGKTRYSVSEIGMTYLENEDG